MVLAHVACDSCISNEGLCLATSINRSTGRGAVNACARQSSGRASSDPFPAGGLDKPLGLDVGARGIEAGSDVLEPQGLANFGQATCDAGQPGGVINGSVDAHARGTDQVAWAPDSRFLSRPRPNRISALVTVVKEAACSQATWPRGTHLRSSVRRRVRRPLIRLSSGRAAKEGAPPHR